MKACEPSAISEKPKHLLSVRRSVKVETSTGFEVSIAARRRTRLSFICLLHEARPKPRVRARTSVAATGTNPSGSVSRGWPSCGKAGCGIPMELRLLPTQSNNECRDQRGPGARWKMRMGIRSDAEVVYTLKLRNAPWGYPSIVGVAQMRRKLNYMNRRGPVNRASDTRTWALRMKTTRDVTRTCTGW